MGVSRLVGGASGGKFGIARLSPWVLGAVYDASEHGWVYETLQPVGMWHGSVTTQNMPDGSVA